MHTYTFYFFFFSGQRLWGIETESFAPAPRKVAAETWSWIPEPSFLQVQSIDQAGTEKTQAKGLYAN